MDLMIIWQDVLSVQPKHCGGEHMEVVYTQEISRAMFMSQMFESPNESIFQPGCAGDPYIN